MKLLVLLLVAGVTAIIHNHPDVLNAEIILTPLINNYERYIYDNQFDKLTRLYHPHAVMTVIHANKAYFEPPYIFAAIKHYRRRVGTSRTKMINETYSGSGDVLMYENRWIIETDEAEMSGPYRAIWIRYKGSFVIYHEEFSFDSVKHKF